MPESIAATIVAIHVIVIMIDFAGALTVFRNRFKVARLPMWQQIYLGIMFGKSLSLITFDSCALTIAENFFWRMGNSNNAYTGSFVSHYLPSLPTEIDLLITCLLMLAGLVAVLRFAGYQIKSCFSKQPTVF